FERELTGKFAGLRTHILVCLGACIFTIISIYGFKFMTEAGVIGINDPARVAAQIITGIGFIGAGAVMHHCGSISGITTAATLWVAAAVGMSCGCGMFSLAVVATLASLVVLISIRTFEKRILLPRHKRVRHVTISITCDAIEEELVMKTIRDNFKEINKIDKKIENSENLVLKINITTRKPLFKINELLSRVDHVRELEIREIHE
ncbi:putative Mg2+ transporter-C (MgtC) family protein, partial [Candidatus Gastranaerophilus sp. (ex Termes propinquus)]